MQARVVIEDSVGIYEIPHINQVSIIYRGPMTAPIFAPGVEEGSSLIRSPGDDIPRNRSLAFPSAQWSSNVSRPAVAERVRPPCPRSRWPDRRWAEARPRPPGFARRVREISAARQHRHEGDPQSASSYNVPSACF